MTVAMRATKTERGVKRRCGACDAPFYDLLRYPIQCPKCGTAFNAAARTGLSSAKRFKAGLSRVRAAAAPVPGLQLDPVKRRKAKNEEAESEKDTDGDELILDDEDED